MTGVGWKWVGNFERSVGRLWGRTWEGNFLCYKLGKELGRKKKVDFPFRREKTIDHRP